MSHAGRFPKPWRVVSERQADRVFDARGRCTEVDSTLYRVESHDHDVVLPFGRDRAHCEAVVAAANEGTDLDAIADVRARWQAALDARAEAHERTRAVLSAEASAARREVDRLRSELTRLQGGGAR